MSQNEQEASADDVALAPDDIENAPEPAERRQVEQGLTYLLEALGSNIVNIRQVAAHTYAVAEALIAKGVLNLADIEKRRDALGEEFMREALDEWTGARLNTDESDKYAPENQVQIDCASRVHLCQAACCKMKFFLSSQDLDEGVVRWEYGRPYLIRQLSDGYCYHSDRGTGACTVHEHRPLPCRQYDCRDDERIWLDFDKMIPNPNLTSI